MPEAKTESHDRPTSPPENTSFVWDNNWCSANQQDWQIVNNMGKQTDLSKYGFGELLISDDKGSAAKESKDDSAKYPEITGKNLLPGIEYSLVEGKETAQERNKLVANLKESTEGLSQNEQSRFKIFIGNFEERMQGMEANYMKQGMDQTAAHKKVEEQIKETYHHLNRILDKDTPDFAGLSPEEKSKLVRQVLENSCNTTDVRQGNHSTCNVAAIEGRTYAQEPAAAAKMVADVVLTGEYQTRDGSTIKIDKGSLQPHDEAKMDPLPDGGRNFASQVFQVAAVNVYHQRHGSWRYEQREASGEKGDTGERLVDYSQNPPKEGPTLWDELRGKDSEYFYRSPQLGGERIIDIGDQIMDNGNQPWYFAAKDAPTFGQPPTVDSPESLKEALEEAKRSGELPIVLRVNTQKEPFLKDSGNGEAGGSGGWHVVTVTNIIDGDPPKVAVDNQWDKNSDRTSREKALDYDTLYQAMRPNA